MLRHIVLWNLKENALGSTREQNAALIKNRLEGLVGKIDGLRKLTVAPGIVEGGYDLCLYAEFSDLSALQFYRTHPLHLEIQKFVHAVITDRVSCDTNLE